MTNGMDDDDLQGNSTPLTSFAFTASPSREERDRMRVGPGRAFDGVRASLKTDRELRERWMIRGLDHDLDVADVVAQPLADRFKKRFDLRRVALGYQFDPAIGQVADVSADCVILRQSTARVAESDS